MYTRDYKSAHGCMLSSVCANMHAVLHKHTYATTPSAVPSVDCPATAAAHGVAHQLPCNGPGKSSSAGWQAAALPMALGHVALWGEGGGGGRGELPCAPPALLA